MQTTAAGNQEEVCYSYPFGDGLTCTGSDATEHHFTSKERDAESGLDYFGARYLSSDLGRFMTPDWAAAPTAVPYATFGDPESLNLYVYVSNNPNTGIDANGHCGGVENCGGGSGIPVDGAWGTFDNPPDRNRTGSGSGTSSAPPAPPEAQQQNPNQAVGNTTEGSLAKVLTNEDGSLSTPKGGDPQQLVDGKTTLANAIYNNANLAHPEKVAPDTGAASAQDSQIMQGVVTSRTNGGADPAQGRVYYGTSHTPKLTSRSAGNGLKGAAGRETVFAKFGPFKDSISSRQTYIYIYNNPGH
jgi:RHS repeat-associated protein